MVVMNETRRTNEKSYVKKHLEVPLVVLGRVQRHSAESRWQGLLVPSGKASSRGVVARGWCSPLVGADALGRWGDGRLELLQSTQQGLLAC